MFSPSVSRVGDDPVDARDDLGDVDRTRPVADLHADDAGLRRDTDEARRVVEVGANRLFVVAGDDARHVRAVTEPVLVGEIIRRRIEGEVGAVDDLGRRARRRDQSLDRLDAGVDERDVDALTVRAGAPVLVGADRELERCASSTGRSPGRRPVRSDTERRPRRRRSIGRRGGREMPPAISARPSVRTTALCPQAAQLPGRSSGRVESC